ncbi:predicted protein [Naegleria gruberi]|uniref:Predicted protein n=1 Tax=Naegleria gruberi TaxID=5762 RepID=D2V3T6_NAEGR|nr:uncharacterized protein NAEGRDRAFT_46465 [Naegleria gruberi]EFC48251.1 predicted protein [Naegleria gruberi]|eukprot:XP_002680995.1 predicted protein [Naegleria gruberi strain NEG-M]
MSYQQTIKLPQANIAGHIIGQKGSQINKLKEITGCFINVKSEQSLVEIKGRKMENVNEAVRLIQLIINNSMAVYEHPNAVCSVLKDIGNESKFHFVEFGKSIHGTEVVYRLVLDSSQKLNQEEMLLDQMNNLNLQDRQLIDKNRVSHTYIHSKVVENVLIEEGVERVSNNLLEISKDNSLKHKMMIKISLGKKAFYSADRSVKTLDTNKMYTFPEFSNLSIGYGKDLKSTWKTEQDEKFITKLKEFLQTDDWVMLNESEGVSCHCVEIVQGIVGRDNSKGGKRLDFKVVRDCTNKCKLTKIRRQMNKLMFLDICQIQPDDTSSIIPDMRIRFQTEQHELNPHSHTDLSNYISHLEFQQEELSDRNVPTMLKNQFSKDTFRYKKKQIFKKENCKLSINYVCAESRKWFEVQLSPLVPFTLLESSENCQRKEEIIGFTAEMIAKMNDILERMNTV